MQVARVSSEEARPSAKLALVSALLASDAVVECAKLATDYLVEHAGVREIVIVAPAPEDDSASCLVALASAGVPAAHVAALAVDTDDRDHPLVAALASPKPVALHEGDGDPPRRVFSSGRYVALPLPLPPRSPFAAVGLLLSGDPPRANAELRWVAGVLGRKLVTLRKLRALAAEERRLARERSLLHTILSSVPDPVLLTDTEGKLVVANPRAEHHFAAHEGQSEGRRRAVALNNMLFSAALSRTALEGAEAIRRELPLVDPTDGSDRLFELLSTVISTPEGPGVVSVLRNVTDLQLAMQEIEDNYGRLRVAEAEVRTEKDRLDLIIDSVADPILVSDPNGAIVMMNTPAERLFTAPNGGSPEEATRVRANDAHFSSHVSNLYFSGQAARTGARFRGELGLVDPRSGAAVPVEAISGKVLSEHGEVIAVVTILHDRSEALEKARLYDQLKRGSEELEAKVRAATAELVRHNELLRRQHIELEQASNLKSQFLANMSHEFRTPLNAILGYTSMLLQGVNGELAAPQKRSLSRVDSNARHLLSIINDILDIARIEAGKMPVNLSVFALPVLVEEVLAEVDPLVARSSVAVVADLPSELPRMRSDRPKLKQILVNLLSNALKFTREGSITIAAQHTPRAKQVTISVADTGIGIDPKDQQTIFMDFRQADNSPTRQYGGAGLGLAICRRLAIVLGGTITVTSALGRGSTFTLVLPIRSRTT